MRSSSHDSDSHDSGSHESAYQSKTLAGLEEFLDITKYKTSHANSVEVFFRPTDIKDIGIMGLVTTVADILKSGDCPNNLSIDFSDLLLGPKEAIVLAEALKSGHCPKALCLNLSQSSIEFAGVQAFAEALKTSACPASLHLDFSANGIKAEEAELLAAALESGKCPPDFKLSLGQNRIGAKGALALSKALSSGKCPPKLSLDLHFNKIGFPAAIFFANAIMSGNCPADLELDLSGNRLTEEGADKFISALKTNMRPPKFTFYIANDPRITAEQRKEIDSLLNPSARPDLGHPTRAAAAGAGADPLLTEIDERLIKLQLFLQTTKEEKLLDEESKATVTASAEIEEIRSLIASTADSSAAALDLATEIKIKQITSLIYLTQLRPAVVHPICLDLSDAYFGIEEAEQLAKILTSGFCPPGLEIRLHNSVEEHKAIKILAEVLSSGKGPAQLNLDFTWYDLNNNHPFYDSCGSTDLNQHYGALFESLSSGGCPTGLQLNFTHSYTRSSGILSTAERYLSGIDLFRPQTPPSPKPIYIGGLASALQSTHCPEGLAVNLDNNFIGDSGAALLALVLKTRRCPPGLKLSLNHCGITPSGIDKLIEALESGNCPPNLSLNLGGNEIHDEQLAKIALLLQSDRCPSGLELEIDRPSVEAIKIFSTNKTRPIRLKLHGGGNNINFKEHQTIADFLVSGHCPPGLWLDVSSSPFGAKEFNVLAQALDSGRCPPGIGLAIYDNNLDDSCVATLAKLLQSGRCPVGLSLTLDLTSRSAEAMELLISALESRKCPPGLKLNTKYWYVPRELEKRLADALKAIPPAPALAVITPIVPLPPLPTPPLIIEPVSPELLAEAESISPLYIKTLDQFITLVKANKFPQEAGEIMLQELFFREGAELLAQALESGRCKTADFALELDDNGLGPEGAISLARALASGKCPESFFLGIYDNKIGIVGIKVFATALESGKCPTNLHLQLCDKAGIGNEGAILLIKALESGRCPRGLKLVFSDDNVDKVLLDRIKALLEDLPSAEAPAAGAGGAGASSVIEARPTLTRAEFMSLMELMVKRDDISEAVFNNPELRIQRLEQTHIEINPKLKAYYQTVSATLLHTFHAAQVIRSGLVDSKDELKQKQYIDYGLRAFDFLTSSLDFTTTSLPGLSHGAKVLAALSKGLISITQQNRIKNLLSLAPATATKLNQLIDRIARTFSLAFEDEVAKLEAKAMHPFLEWYQRWKDRLIVNDLASPEQALAFQHANQWLGYGMLNNPSFVSDLSSDRWLLLFKPDCDLSSLEYKRTQLRTRPMTGTTTTIAITSPSTIITPSTSGGEAVELALLRAQLAALETDKAARAAAETAKETSLAAEKERHERELEELKKSLAEEKHRQQLLEAKRASREAEQLLEEKAKAAALAADKERRERELEELKKSLAAEKEHHERELEELKKSLAAEKHRQQLVEAERHRLEAEKIAEEEAKAAALAAESERQTAEFERINKEIRRLEAQLRTKAPAATGGSGSRGAGGGLMFASAFSSDTKDGKAALAELDKLKALARTTESSIREIEKALAELGGFTATHDELHAARIKKNEFKSSFFSFETAIKIIKLIADKKYGVGRHSLILRSKLGSSGISIAKELQGVASAEPKMVQGEALLAVLKKLHLAEVLSITDLSSSLETGALVKAGKEPSIAAGAGGGITRDETATKRSALFDSGYRR